MSEVKKHYADIERREAQTMSPTEFRNGGYLLEINRRFLHPLGMALAVEFDEVTGEAVGLGPIWDYRSDPEGMIFEDLDDDDQARAVKVAGEWVEKQKVREQRFGWMVQPIPIVSGSEGSIES